MSKLKDFVNDVITSTIDQFATAGVNNHELIGKVGMGVTNVGNEEHALGQAVFQNAEQALDNALSLVLSKEDYLDIGTQLTEAQKAAGKFALAIASNRGEYARQLSNLRGSNVPGVINVPSESLGIEDYGDPDIISNNILSSLSNNYQNVGDFKIASKKAGLGLEAYDGQKLNNSIYFSIAFNIAASKQDDFGEAFFPTLTIDPLQSGIDVTIEYATVYNEFNRSITGSPDKDKYGKKAVVKSVFDDNIFGANKNRVIPVYRENENKDKFVSDLKYVNTVTGKEILTAPLVFGQTVSLLGLGATDEMLAKGAVDNTDALDRTINLEKVYYQIDKDYYAIDTTIFEYSGFVANPQQHFKDLMLSFSAEHSIDVSKVKTAKGAASEAWKSVATKYNGYIVVFDLNISGNANTETSDIEINAVKFNFKKIVDANGAVVAASDPAYNEIKAIAEKAKPVGYVVEATRTNSNIRTRGILVTTDRYNYNYNVPFRSGVTALLPTNNSQGTDNGADTLANQILLVGLFISNSAVNKLIDTAAAMNVAANNGMLVTGYGNGAARHLVEPYFNQVSFDINTIVDSVSSTTRTEDIRAALLNNIKLEVLNMYLVSNYGVALDEYKGNMGVKPTVIIGTDPLLKSLLVQDSNTFALDGTFDVHVVATKNPKMRGKMYLTFGIFDSKRNTEVNVFNFGNCVWSPTLSFDIVKTTNNATSLELYNNPRFAHIIHLPILTEFIITDVNRVFSKLPMYTRNIKPELQAENMVDIFNKNHVLGQNVTTGNAAAGGATTGGAANKPAAGAGGATAPKNP